MTYIVDQKVVGDTLQDADLKGMGVMGSNPGHLMKWLRTIGNNGTDDVALHTTSLEMENILSRIEGWLKVIAFHLQLGSDAEIKPGDLEGHQNAN